MAFERFEELINKYIEGTITLEEREILNEHIRNCAECREELKAMEQIVKTLNSVEQVELPHDYMSTLHDKLVRVSSKQSTDRTSFNFSGLKKALTVFSGFVQNKRRIAAGIAVILVGIIGIKILTQPTFDNLSMSGSGEIGIQQSEMAEEDSFFVESDEGIDNESRKYLMKSAPQEQALEQPSLMSSTPLEEESVRERKIIKSAGITVYVEHFEQKLESSIELAQRYGGYVENSNVTSYDSGIISRQANITIRVPEDKLMDAVEEIRSFGKCQSENISGQEITDSYYDTDAKVRNLKRQEERLLELLNMANNVDELLRIENELNRVRTEQDQLTGQLRAWDKMIRLSSININLIEQRPSKETVTGISFNEVLGKIREGFITALNVLTNALAWVAHLTGIILPVGAVIAFLCIIILIIYNRTRRNKK